MPDARIILPNGKMPTQWYNIAADIPTPIGPPLHPGTGEPIGPEALTPIFPMGLIMQEVSQERWIPIPEEVLKIYSLWRPTPLHRALNLEAALKTPARIYYKNEGLSPPGSHKPNTAVAQAYYNKAEGIKRLTTETGAGQWGSALALGCNFFGLECKVYMVKASYHQKPYRRTMMQSWGASVTPSPSEETNSGRKILEGDPECRGSLGIAISEAIEDAAGREDTNYSLGSVLNHVLLHQTIIGLEAMEQFKLAGDYPDIIIGCVGGGSNFAGTCFPFLRDKIAGKELRAIAAEPTACPSLTRGLYAYDFGDTSMLTPLLLMFTLGHGFVPAPIHAGGLRYHGDAPMLCHLVKDGLIEAVAYAQNPVFEAAVTFCRAEGIIPAPETAHAIKAVIDEAVKCREEGKEKVIFFNMSGHGHFDMSAYDDYFDNALEDFALPQEEIDRAMAELPKIPGK